VSAQILHAQTPLLDVAYESGGSENGAPVVLLHGWPDDVRTYDGVRPALDAAGFRTIAPWLRGFGATRFLSSSTPRSGQIAAMAQDTLDFADTLGIGRFHIVGHDWGARIAYFLASTSPARVERMVTLSAGWDPGPWKTPALPQAKNFWYQWFMATERGAEVVRRDPVAFARFQWATWSPPEWFDESVFAATSASFDNPDWVAITLHSYRVRWDEAESDPRYADLERRQQAVRTISVPTLLIHGEQDRCVGVSTSEGKEPHFSGGYERRVIADIGHFPTREAPETVAAWIVEFLKGRPEGRPLP
jgi:pimeloyl-ACP methyl ester carboxylesterase